MNNRIIQPTIQAHPSVNPTQSAMPDLSSLVCTTIASYVPTYLNYLTTPFLTTTRKDVINRLLSYNNWGHAGITGLLSWNGAAISSDALSAKQSYTRMGARFISPLNSIAQGALLSATYRVLTIGESAFQRKIETQNWSRKVKLTASITLSAVPPAIMYSCLGVVGIEFYASTVLFNTLSELSSSFSPAWGNWFKELNAASATKGFNFVNSMVRSVITMGITVTKNYCELWNMKAPSLIGFAEKDALELVKCTSPDLHVTGFSLRKSKTTWAADYLCDHIGLFLGRMLVDLSLAALQKCGFIEDLRRPTFRIPRFADRAEHIVVEVAPPQATHVLPPAVQYTAEERAEQRFRAQGALTAPSQSTRVRVTLKTRRVAPTPEPAPALEEDITSYEDENIEISGYGSKLVKLSGHAGSRDNVWAIIDCRTVADSEIFVRSLESSGHIGARAAIKYLSEPKKYEIRPGGTGDRVLGKLIKGDEVYDRLKTILPLGQAQEVEARLRATGDVQLVYFNERVAHREVEASRGR